MNPSSDTIGLLVLACLLAVVSLASYGIGIRRGRAMGWCERYFSDVQKDRARRRRNGQFKPHHEVRAHAIQESVKARVI